MLSLSRSSCLHRVHRGQAWVLRLLAVVERHARSFAFCEPLRDHLDCRGQTILCRQVRLVRFLAYPGFLGKADLLFCLHRMDNEEQGK